jgi:two-component system chemotaxis response regulator CheY
MERKMHALVIDDSKAMRLILKTFLRQIGFTVSEAGNGRAGLEELARMDKPDVVFVDCFMPEMDGYEFLRAVRTDARYSGLPVLMASAGDDPAEQGRALDLGADAFLTKPLTRKTLQTKLQHLGVAVGTATTSAGPLIAYQPRPDV